MKLTNNASTIVPLIAETIKSVPPAGRPWRERIMLGCWLVRLTLSPSQNCETEILSRTTTPFATNTSPTSASSSSHPTRVSRSAPSATPTPRKSTSTSYYTPSFTSARSSSPRPIVSKDKTDKSSSGPPTLPKPCAAPSVSASTVSSRTIRIPSASYASDGRKKIFPIGRRTGLGSASGWYWHW